MKENFDCGNPEDHERHNSWPTEELLPGFRHFTEDFFQVRSPPIKYYISTWRSDHSLKKI